ncbi:hypothetical protein Celaphus_00011265, partial [Cervus elaphus hippelaphus]
LCDSFTITLDSNKLYRGRMVPSTKDSAFSLGWKMVNLRLQDKHTGKVTLFTLSVMLATVSQMVRATSHVEKEAGPPLLNAVVSYPPGSAVEYQCQAYYVLQGDRYIVCRNGEWSEPPKCLDPCVISEEMMKQHNIQLKWRDDKKIYTRTDDTIEFTCKRGYRPRTPNHTFRTTCQKGKL